MPAQVLLVERRPRQAQPNGQQRYEQSSEPVAQLSVCWLLIVERAEGNTRVHHARRQRASPSGKMPDKAAPVSTRAAATHDLRNAQRGEMGEVARDAVDRGRTPGRRPVPHRLLSPSGAAQSAPDACWGYTPTARWHASPLLPQARRFRCSTTRALLSMKAQVRPLRWRPSGCVETVSGSTSKMLSWPKSSPEPLAGGPESRGRMRRVATSSRGN